MIEEDIEAKLAHAAANEPPPPAQEGGSNVLSFGAYDEPHAIADRNDLANQGAQESRVMEIQALKKRVAELSKENAVLRHELSIARSKLEQIKKIA